MTCLFPSSDYLYLYHSEMNKQDNPRKWEENTTGKRDRGKRGGREVREVCSLEVGLNGGLRDKEAAVSGG